MFSQLLLLAAWRDLAASPDSSASSHEPIPWGSRPVRWASRDANCCWPGVRRPLAAADGPCAWASASAKEAPATGEVPAVAPVAVAPLAPTSGAGAAPLKAAI